MSWPGSARCCSARRAGRTHPSRQSAHRLLAQDAFALAGPACQPLLAGLAARTRCDLFDDDPAVWRECYRVLQGAEIWQAHGDWITRAKPAFAPDIAARFAGAAAITAAETARMAPIRHRITRHLHALLPPGTVVLLPTAPGPALSRDAGTAAIGALYAQALALTAAAGHAGLPQITVPVKAPGCPLGLSALGWPGSDAAMLQRAASAS